MSCLASTETASPPFKHVVLGTYMCCVAIWVVTTRNLGVICVGRPQMPSVVQRLVFRTQLDTLGSPARSISQWSVGGLGVSLQC